MAEMTLGQALVRGADGWARGGYRYDTLDAATEYADVGDRIYALDSPEEPTAAELADDMLEWIHEHAMDLNARWEFLAEIDEVGDVCGCVADDDDEVKAHLLAACEALLRHFGHPQAPVYESVDWVVVTQEMIDGGAK